ncbi:hypothetical protein CVT24_006186 [Panaeolus cyanescens]|uniref:Serine/threonine-protein phosphatase n=1 Tax=Panaeolus cyanescens TaxID=181874 RepID=A0A409V8P4_9AGAR|nr:hypothetical protein CVT24_006186 [Panaeolus cyanescens]
MSDSSASSPSLSSTTPPSSVPSPQLQSLTLNDISDQDKAESARLKALANKAFTSHDFPGAAKLYTEAIEKNPCEPTLWCNRAYARMKLEEYGYALSDATQAIALDPKYAKAYYRRATCQMQILKPQAAVADFKKVLALEPGNDTVRAQLVSTQKLIRKIEFEKAIEFEGEKNPVDRCREIIAEGGCEVDAAYNGPVLPQRDGKYYMSEQFIQEMIQWYKDGKTLAKRYAWEIVLGAHEQFAKEESLVTVPVEEGVTCDVIGDVHGQFYDVLHLLSLTGTPSEKHYLLFNGDLVDRGSWSIEVILLAFAYKWLYPKYMFINRGNHEAKDMNRTYGFEGEAKHKHGEQAYKLFAHVFTALPLATLVSATKPPATKDNSILSPDGLKRFFVVHGGLFSKDGVTLDDIRKLERIGRQPGQEGLMCEVCLLWTDPQEANGRGPSKRGVGIAFGPDVTKRWCTLNGVTGVIRSHEVRQNGYEIEHDGLCTTVFSAPNYVDQSGNKGAFIRVDAAGNRQYTQFEASPHPPMKPMAYVQGGLGSLMIMDKTKSKLAAFFDNDDDESSFPVRRIELFFCLQQPLDDVKMSKYTSGSVRKSRREKEQEAADAKRREEEASAAQAYAEFLDEFEGEGSGRKGGSAFVQAESKSVYAPSVPRRMQPMRSPSPPSTMAPKPKGKRAMDSFLEEIKREQAEREAKYSRHGSSHGRSATAMAAYEGQSGSKDRGDPLTTNLFVANLPHHVTEPLLGNFFAKIGPVGSVKIMWPRMDGTVGPGADMTATRKAKSTGLNGFVSYMTRRHAEEALREFDGCEWGGTILRVGWSKAVPLAPKPMYVLSHKPASSRSRSRSRSRSKERDNWSRDHRHRHSRRSRSRSWEHDRSRSPMRRRSRSRTRRFSSNSRSPSRRSRSPRRHDESEIVTDTFIRAVASEVRGHDAKYEDMLKDREKSNPKYNFLLQRSHRRHAYYRGLVESEEPFKQAFDDDGYNSVYSTDSEEESEREQTRKTTLGSSARQRFEAMLRIHAFIGHPCHDFIFQVADIIVASLLVDGTPVPRKVARLHLICDILHNSAASVPSAWKFRQEFQARLGIVFDHMANIYHSFPGRITADLFKKQITTVVDIWEDWIVFPPDFTTELRKRLEGAAVPQESATEEQNVSIRPPSPEFAPRFKKTGFKPATVEVQQNVTSDTESMDVSEDENTKDIDGQAVEEDNDIDGEPVDDIDGEPVAVPMQTDTVELDGEPVDDIDGDPVDADLDGEPL